MSSFEDGRADDEDNNHTADDQCNRDECDQKNAASAGRKFAPNDPIL